MRVLIVYDPAKTEPLSAELWALAETDEAMAEMRLSEHSAAALHKATGIAKIFSDRVLHREVTARRASSRKPGSGTSVSVKQFPHGAPSARLEKSPVATGGRNTWVAPKGTHDAVASAGSAAERKLGRFVFNQYPTEPHIAAGRKGHEFFVYTRIGAVRQDELEDGVLAIATAISTLRINAVLIFSEDLLSPAASSVLGVFAAYPTTLRDVTLFTMNRTPNGQTALALAVAEPPGTKADGAQQIIARSDRARRAALIPGAAHARSLRSPIAVLPPFSQAISVIDQAAVAAWTPGEARGSEQIVWQCSPFKMMGSPNIWACGPSDGPVDEELQRKLRVALAAPIPGLIPPEEDAGTIIKLVVEAARDTRYAEPCDTTAAQNALVDLCRVTQALAAHHFGGPTGSAAYGEEGRVVSCGLYNGRLRDPLWAVQMYLHARALLEMGKAAGSLPTPYAPDLDHLGGILGTCPTADALIVAIRNDTLAAMKRAKVPVQIFDDYFARDVAAAIPAVRAAAVKEYVGLMREACGYEVPSLNWALEFGAGCLVFPIILIRHLMDAIEQYPTKGDLEYHLMMLSLSGPLTEPDLRGIVAVAQSYIHAPGPVGRPVRHTEPVLGELAFSLVGGGRIIAPWSPPGADRSPVGSPHSYVSSIISPGFVPDRTPLEQTIPSPKAAGASRIQFTRTDRDEIERAEWSVERPLTGEPGTSPTGIRQALSGSPSSAGFGVAVSWDTVGAIPRGGAASPAGSIATSLATPMQSGTNAGTPSPQWDNNHSPLRSTTHLRAGAWAPPGSQELTPSHSFMLPNPQAPVPVHWARSPGQTQRSTRWGVYDVIEPPATPWRQEVGSPSPSARSEGVDEDRAAVAYPTAANGLPLWVRRIYPMHVEAGDDVDADERPTMPPTHWSPPSAAPYMMDDQAELEKITVDEALHLAGPVIRSRWDMIGNEVFAKVAEFPGPGERADRQIDMLAAAYALPHGVIAAVYRAFHA
jgi:hypothetical protein